MLITCIFSYDWIEPNNKKDIVEYVIDTESKTHIHSVDFCLCTKKFGWVWSEKPNKTSLTIYKLLDVCIYLYKFSQTVIRKTSKYLWKRLSESSEWNLCTFETWILSITNLRTFLGTFIGYAVISVKIF